MWESLMRSHGGSELSVACDPTALLDFFMEALDQILGQDRVQKNRSLRLERTD
jgi:hypothetical protein